MCIGCVSMWGSRRSTQQVSVQQLAMACDQEVLNICSDLFDDPPSSPSFGSAGLSPEPLTLGGHLENVDRHQSGISGISQ